VENPSIFSTILDSLPSSPALSTPTSGQPIQPVPLEPERLSTAALTAVASSSGTVSPFPPALICTSGPASAAAIRWIQRCLKVSGDCRIYYSGDFDVKGLSMGLTMAGLFPQHFRPWRFGVETYQAAANRHPGPPFDASELARLESMNVGWDPELGMEMSRTGCKIHQEAFVELLVRDYGEFWGLLDV
jgi:hypothetical protein